MLKKTCLGTTLVLALLWSGLFATSGQAQDPVPGGAPPPPCARPQIQCPAPFANDTFVHINLEPDANSVCRFNPRIIEDLQTSLGGNVQWSFCSECQVNMQVQLDVPGGSGPFDRFTAFIPMPSADNLVSVPVPCNDFGRASGFSATGSGEWKYFLRARPAGETSSFPDEIDPRLEIDDRPLAPPDRNVWPERILLVVVGFLAGAYIMRRRSSPSQAP